MSADGGFGAAGHGPGPAERPDTEAALRRRIAETRVEGTPAEMRRAFARLTGPSAALSRSRIGGEPVARVGDGPRRILWLHGGGYVFGSPESHGAAALGLARRVRGTVLLPDYPLAPEHLWPAQRIAVQKVVDALDGPLGLIGDSAGGHLALRLALDNPGRFDALALLSPNTDRTGRSGTRDRPDDAMNDDATDTRLFRMAFGGMPAESPEASPLLADLSGLPPTLVMAAEAEMLLDDALLLAQAAVRQGVRTDLAVWPGLFHLWPLWPAAMPEARSALDTAAGHLARYLPIPSKSIQGDRRNGP